jgi:hypothetical protein
MGAFLQIKPCEGRFDTDQIVSYIEDNENVLKMDQNEETQYIFLDPDTAHEQDDNITAASVIEEEDNPEASMPRINIGEDNEITLNLNWNDTSNNDIRYFTQWLLSKYECKGSDFQGYEFCNNEELKYWIDMWLPRDPKKYM